MGEMRRENACYVYEYNNAASIIINFVFYKTKKNYFITQILGKPDKMPLAGGYNWNVRIPPEFHQKLK